MSSTKVAVVTGANKGIGFAIVKGLCKKFEGTVYLTARNAQKGNEAVAKLTKLGLSPKFHQLDVVDRASIVALRNYIVDKHGGIDLLVNNAGIYNDNDATKTIETNYFGVYNVCDVLFPILRTDARVVNVSSQLGHLSFIPSGDVHEKLRNPKLTLAQLNGLMREYLQDVGAHQSENRWGNSAYAVSKVGVTALTFIQQRSFDDDPANRNVSVIAVHPGYVDTDLTEHKGVLTPDEGARSTLCAAFDPRTLKGEFLWSDCRTVQWDSIELPIN